MRALPRCGCIVAALLLAPPLVGARAQEATVARRMVDDRKAVIATVEPAHELVARARIVGTIASLSVKEGDEVATGDRLALVVDQKLLLQMQALQSRLQAQQATRDQTQIDLSRVLQLRRTGVASQAQLDQAQTALDVAQRTLQAIDSDRRVVEQQAAEGAVLAPGAGRVLKVPVQPGTVVLAGETIATLAARNYILRLQLPERHARFIKPGDPIQVGARGLSAQPEAEDPPGEDSMREGRVVLVYPEIDGGRVIADVQVSGLGDYFVGERTRVYVATGKRPALVIPAGYVYRHFGVSFVRLADGAEIAVQPGMPVEGGVEILAGLAVGDVVKKP